MNTTFKALKVDRNDSNSQLFLLLASGTFIWLIFDILWLHMTLWHHDMTWKQGRQKSIDINMTLEMKYYEVLRIDPAEPAKTIVVENLYGK